MESLASREGDGIFIFTKDEKKFKPWLLKAVKGVLYAKKLPLYQELRYSSEKPYVGITSDGKDTLYAIYEEGKPRTWKLDIFRITGTSYRTRVLTSRPPKHSTLMDVSWEGNTLLILFQVETIEGYPLYLQSFSPEKGATAPPLKLETEGLLLEGKNRKVSFAKLPSSSIFIIFLPKKGFFEVELEGFKIKKLAPWSDLPLEKAEPRGLTFWETSSAQLTYLSSELPQILLLGKGGKTTMDIRGLPPREKICPYLMDHGFSAPYFTFLDLSVKVQQLERKLGRK